MDVRATIDHIRKNCSFSDLQAIIHCVSPLVLLTVVGVLPPRFGLPNTQQIYLPCRSDPEFERTLASTFEGDYRLRFHLAIPMFSRTDPNTGMPKKHAYGSWMRLAMKPLAQLKFLRGTAFDPFGRTEERRLERTLIRREGRGHAEGWLGLFAKSAGGPKTRAA